MKISAKTKAKPTPVTVDYDVPETLDAQVAKFGKEVVAAHAGGSIVISGQAFIRRHIAKGSTPAQIQEAMKTWKPDVRSAVKQSAFEKAAKSISGLSEAERAQLLKDLQSKVQSNNTPAKPALKSA